MNADLKGGAAAASGEPAVERSPLRFVSAASLFDGHDAAINMIRRLLQARGAEVVHLGHNRSVADIVRAAIDEDADAIAVSSYQGGHNEYFAYMVDMLRERGCEHIRVVVGGGGTIAPAAGQTNTLAIISLVAGIGSFFAHIIPGVGGFTVALVAVITGSSPAVNLS